MEGVKKPYILNYFLLLLVILIFLIAIYFPTFFPYHDWLSFYRIPILSAISVPYPILLLIGNVFTRFFMFFIPLVTILYLSKRYIYKGNRGTVFFKLPLMTLLVSVIGIIISYYFISFQICSGEDCLGWAFLGIISIFGFLVLSFIFSFFVYLINTRQRYGDLFIRLDNSRIFLIAIVVILLGSIIYLIYSLYLSYNCEPISGPNYYSFNDCQTFKKNIDVEKEFYSGFPKEFKGLIRSDVKTDYDGITTYDFLGIQNYLVTYSQFYLGPAYNCLYDNRCLTLVVLRFDNSQVLESELNKGLLNFNESSYLKTEYAKNNQIFEFKEIDLEGSKLFVLGHTTQTAFVWVEKSNKGIIEVITNGGASLDNSFDREIVSYFLDKYPSR